MCKQLFVSLVSVMLLSTAFAPVWAQVPETPETPPSGPQATPSAQVLSLGLPAALKLHPRPVVQPGGRWCGPSRSRTTGERPAYRRIYSNICRCQRPGNPRTTGHNLERRFRCGRHRAAPECRRTRRVHAWK